MFILGYLIQAAAGVLDIVLYFFMLLIIARAVLSWVSPDPYNPIVRFIHNVTEPVLHRVRTKVPLAVSGIDFSPIIVILVIYFLQVFAVNSLHAVAARMLSGH
jgi:YggT family protein